jgi:hypothetical protein
VSVILQHLQTHLVVYLVLLACLAPIVYFTRRWSVPLVLYVIEFVIYIVCMHLFVYGVVAFCSWYKQESTFRVLADGTRTSDADWGTPLFEVWMRELYKPEWLLYVEVGFLVAIVVGMYRYRPLQVQQQKKKTPIKAPGRYSSTGGYNPPSYSRPKR